MRGLTECLVEILEKVASEHKGYDTIINLAQDSPFINIDQGCDRAIFGADKSSILFSMVCLEITGVASLSCFNVC